MEIATIGAAQVSSLTRTVRLPRYTAMSATLTDIFTVYSGVKHY